MGWGGQQHRRGGGPRARGLNLRLVAGAVYAAFYKDPTGANTLIGNFSMGLVPVGANTVHLTFPSSFDATTLLKTPGKYALVETYYPTPDFTQPVPLTVQFTVTVRRKAPLVYPARVSWLLQVQLHLSPSMFG